MPEYPGPIRLPGEDPAPREPHEIPRRPWPPAVVDEDTDLFGAEDAAAAFGERLTRVEPLAARIGEGGHPLLTPPYTPGRDRIEGPAPGRATLVVFGAHGTPWSRSLGAVLDEVRRRHPATVGVVWRHHPEPAAHPGAVQLALAVEAAAAAGRFWTLTRELLQLRHHDPRDLHAAIVRSSLDPERTLAAMRAGTGSDRIAGDVASALASGLTYAPALFIDGERYRGDIEPRPVLVALDEVLAAAGAAHDDEETR
jgi:hypothetical protein